MASDRSLPVFLPRVPGQDWSCHSCGDCCRSLVGFLTLEEIRAIDDQNWREELGVAPYVSIGRSVVLNKRENGACVFLADDNRCRIHAKFGEAAKPLACRVFPFSVRPVGGGWQASVRFDCPSTLESKGRPLDSHRAWLTELVAQLPRTANVVDGVVELKRGVPAAPEEVDALETRLLRWLTAEEISAVDRLAGAARAITIIHEANLGELRGPRFPEFLDVLFRALRKECGKPIEPPTARQEALLRQLAFAHAEHVSLGEMREGPLRGARRRWRQLRDARRFRLGEGTVPRVGALEAELTFDALQDVGACSAPAPRVADLLRRYITARLEGKSVFGAGYYGWPVCHGVVALVLSIATAGWLARYFAAAAGRVRLEWADVARAVGTVDRAATRLPALGTLAERARVSYLLRDDGVARLLARYRLIEDPS